MDNILLPILRGKTVIVGIGNPLRGDDGFGPALIQRLRGKVRAACIDAGNAPENYLGPIAREDPDTILLVDVADMGLEPGQCRVLEPKEILKCGLTTHDLSSRMLIEFLQGQTRAHIFMLGVQPQQVSLGEGMSDCVKETLSAIERFVHEAESCTRPI